MITNMKIFTAAMFRFVPKKWRQIHRFYRFNIILIPIKSIAVKSLFFGTILSFSVCLTLPAQANIFDPILRILIPSYKSNDDANNETASDNTEDNTPQTTEQNAHQDRQSKDNDDSFKSSTAAMPSVSSKSSSQSLTTNSLTTNHAPSNNIIEDKDNQPSLYQLLTAEFEADRGQPQVALQIYKQESLKKNATAVFERALNLSLTQEAPEQSLMFAYQWQTQNPDHVPAWFYVAHLALKAHNYELASETLSRILRYDPRADLSQILIGIFPETEADQRELLTTLQQLDNEQNASLSVIQAGLLLRFNEPKAALMHINRALEIQPDNIPFITLKADILKRLNDTDNALLNGNFHQPDPQVILFLDKSIKRLPEAKALYLYKIRYLLEQQQSKNAWEQLLQAHEKFKEDDEITLLAALVGLDISQYPQADALLKTLLEHPAYVNRAYYYLGISAERQHHYHQAKTYLSNVMQEDLVLAARKKIVAFLLLENHVDEAIETLKQLREQFDVFAPDSYILQADILRQQGFIEKAKALLVEANEQYPDDESLIFAHAQLLDDEKDFSKKRNLLKYLINLNDENLTYQLNYAKLVLTKEPNNQQALNMANKIIHIRYDDPLYDNELHLQALIILANHALQQQQFTKVIEYLQTPYDVLPNLQSGILLLKAYQGLGEDDKVATLLADLQKRFGDGQQNIADLLQSY